ncbi:MAG: histidine ammonia-lyase [Dethiosulfovibrio peptidovorans]|nr:MAG: histidine ammonia-lyase [Dethiosulfovibrio peptidovorans]
MSEKKKRVILDGDSLSLDQFVAVTRHGAVVELLPKSIEKIEASRRVVEDLLIQGRPMYGINTGFGRFADVAIPENEINLLQLNLIRADAVGVGEPLPVDVVRGILLLRANSIIKGYSGARLEVIQLLLDMLNRRVHPVIPAKGSVGASGDLCPLSHMVLPMIGEGEVELNGTILPGKDGLRSVGLVPVELRAKEGLALINGTPVMTSLAALGLHDALVLQRSADIVAALTVESLRGIVDAFDPRIHDIRGQIGQVESAANLRKLLDGSSAVTHQGQVRMQDAYSLRCIPQIHGASRMALAYVRSVVDAELNAATDNPLVFTDTGDVFSGGNFHGQPVAVAADTMGIAVAELGNISERRIAKLVDPALNHGLPAFLVRQGGINCGFMVPQYAAAALVSENKILAHPACVDSIPTSAGQEDHVSMGTIGARKARTIVEHVQTVLGIEWMCAAQAVDLQGDFPLGRGTRRAYDLLRESVPFLENDRAFYEEQRIAAAYIADEVLLQGVQEEVGLLA